MDKKYLINHCIYLFTTLIAAVLIGYVIFHLSGSGESNPSTSIAKRLSAGQTITEKGYIFKDEQLLYSDETGSVYSKLAEGTKVHAGAEVAEIFDDPQDLTQVLSAYDRAISILESSNEKGSSKKTETQLRELTAELRRYFEEGNVSSAQRKMERLQVLLNVRKTATGAKNDYNEEIALLKAERAAIADELGEKKETVYAPVPGNYYSKCDGYEEIFTKKAAEELTISSFSELIRSEVKKEDGNNGRPLGKLCQSSTWYLAFLTENGSAPEMTVGQRYALTLQGKGVFEMTLEALLTDQQEGRHLLVFKSDLVPEAGLLERSEQVSLEVAKVSGLMVPTAAVRYLPPEAGSNIADGTGVYVKEGNKLIFKRIRILCETGGYYVVKEFSANEEHAKAYLALNDVVVTSGKELEEGYRN